MHVALLKFTPEPERTVAMAARLCYSATGAAQLAETMTAEQVNKLVEKIVGLGHWSTIEHVSFTFAIEGVSRALSHQLVRHRIASYSQQSQRYVKEDNFAYITPDAIASDAVAKAKFEELMAAVRGVYTELLARGIAAEDARYCLPNAAETKIVVTMNARTLLHFFAERCCMRAQWEIRAMAERMLAKVRPVAPLLFAKAGPTCVSAGVCREGAMTCGRLTAL